MDSQKTKTIQSLEVGYKIIDLVASNRRPLKFIEIQELTGITKSNLYKYLNTLTNIGFLSKDDSSGVYKLGSKFIEYGTAAIGDANVVVKAIPFMEKMIDDLDETIILSVFTDKGPVVVHIIKSTRTLNIGADIGTLLPIYSASGQIFAAYLDRLKIRKWKEQELNALEKEKRRKTEEEIMEAKTNGIAYAIEPLAPSVSSIGIPIYNVHNGLLGVLTMVGFFEPEKIKNDQDLRDYLLSKSEEISKQFGYRPG